MIFLKVASTVAIIIVLVMPELQASPTVYIPLGSANQVIGVVAETSKITATFSGIENPHGLVATPDGEYLIAGSLKEKPLAAGQPPDTPNSQLSLIHLAHGHVMLTIPVAGWTHHQAITPDGHYVISTHATRGYVSVADLEKNQVFKTITTGNAPNYTLITKDARFAYVSNSGSSNIRELDLNTWLVTRSLKAGAAPEHMVFSKDESIIDVANPRAGKVSPISVSTGKVLEKFAFGKRVHGEAISDEGTTLYGNCRKDK